MVLILKKCGEMKFQSIEIKFEKVQNWMLNMY